MRSNQGRLELLLQITLVFCEPRNCWLCGSGSAAQLCALALLKRPLLAQIPRRAGQACETGPGSRSGLEVQPMSLVRFLIVERTRLHSLAPGHHQAQRPTLSLPRRQRPGSRRPGEDASLVARMIAASTELPPLP